MAKIELQDLWASVPMLQSPNARIGVPDGPTFIEMIDAHELFACLDAVLRAFRTCWGGENYLVSADLNEYHQALWIRFVLGGCCDEESNGPNQAALDLLFRDLHAVVVQNGGEIHYSHRSHWFGLSFPYDDPIREAFPEVAHLSWDEQYRQLLGRASWSTLRGMVFRFSNLAERFAARCVDGGWPRVLIPSVGLCIHRWLFAEHGLFVVATDVAESALSALAAPCQWPLLYSQAAFERWDIAESAMYAEYQNPNSFSRMPRLEDPEVLEALRHRITFALSDWSGLPMADGSIDALFATNALPRESDAELFRVLKEWSRVVRPGGIVLIAMHNAKHNVIEPILRAFGWVQADVLSGQRVEQAESTVFQVCYSSG